METNCTLLSNKQTRVAALDWRLGLGTILDTGAYLVGHVEGHALFEEHECCVGMTSL